MRRSLFLSIITAILLIPFLAGAAGLSVLIDGRSAVFSDVPEDAWYATYVRQAAEAGIVSGYRDAAGNLTGAFGPGDPVTIAQAYKIVVEGAGYDPLLYYDRGAPCVSEWYEPYVQTLETAAGFTLDTYIPGFPQEEIYSRSASREELARFITGAFRVTPQYDTHTYADTQNIHFEESIEALTRDGVVSGDTNSAGKPTGYFRPFDTINRAETVKIVMKARQVYGTPGVLARPPFGQMVEVTYHSGGFDASCIRIRHGMTVSFYPQNREIPMWVASDPHPAHSGLLGFDSGRGFAPDESYVYTFTRAGAWNYHNHLYPEHKGMIIVESGEQTESSQGSSANVLQVLEQKLAGWTEQWQALIPNFQLSDLRKAHEGPIRADIEGSLELYGLSQEHLKNYPLLYQSPGEAKSVYVMPNGGMLSPEARQFFVVGFDIDTSVAVIDTTNNSSTCVCSSAAPHATTTAQHGLITRCLPSQGAPSTTPQTKETDAPRTIPHAPSYRPFMSLISHEEHTRRTMVRR